MPQYYLGEVVHPASHRPVRVLMCHDCDHWGLTEVQSDKVYSYLSAEEVSRRWPYAAQAVLEHENNCPGAQQE